MVYNSEKTLLYYVEKSHISTIFYNYRSELGRWVLAVFPQRLHFIANFKIDMHRLNWDSEIKLLCPTLCV